MKVGSVGIGDIACKAYLPVLAAMPGVELHIASRNPETLRRVGDAYRIEGRHTDVDALIGAGIEAAFVHAATEAHPALVERLLRAGIHVYVDKPIADTLAEADRLVRLAEQRDRSLMVGFNRRHAPAYAALRDRPRPVVVMEKNRHALPAPPRRVVFDDFIHVVDTIRFLAEGDIERIAVETRVADGMLEHVSLALSGRGFAALGIMVRTSGSDEEFLEVIGGGEKTRVENVREVLEHRGGSRGSMLPSDWTPVTRARGFEEICRVFLDAVTAGGRIDARDALETHRLCEAITHAAEQGRNGPLAL
ncbi:Gfo/Idh/MocA family protein [Sphingosinicella sp. BN140058]|uniref:Gfo/Idh/MocA family protein n=1 Tax=Sphingosinicella sp. BN140058 TaxID=1892855 RepID=UPI0010109453|nr:Gfo/Idh/MocA family oxidoreductase [Sphingosinicella sp. BN140058]QAY75552.1 Gfo/Idh/MocA family oxidoreductase [Sphingosinicella sp. BN140058]